MPQLSIYAPHVLLLRKANGQALNKLCVLRLVNDSCSFELEIWRANDYKSHIKKHSICMLDNDLGNDLDNCGRWGNALKDKKEFTQGHRHHFHIFARSTEDCSA